MDARLAALDIGRECGDGRMRGRLRDVRRRQFGGRGFHRLRCARRGRDDTLNAGLATMVELNQNYADFYAVILDAGGHFQHLESPERFNPEMRKLVDELRQRRPSSTFARKGRNGEYSRVIPGCFLEELIRLVSVGDKE
jgi:pimeloyl-ACP methyl ester carboxylesterase